MRRLTSVESAIEAIAVAAAGTSGPGIGFGQALPTATGPAHLASGVPDHQGVVGNISGDDGRGADETIASEGDSAQYGGVGTDGGPFSHDGRLELKASIDVASGSGDVGKDRRGSAKDVVLQDDAVVDRDVVLDLDPVTDDDRGGDVDVLSEGTAGTDARSFAYVGPVPDAGVGADAGALGDDGCGVSEILHGTSAKGGRDVDDGAHFQGPIGGVDDGK